ELVELARGAGLDVARVSWSVEQGDATSLLLRAGADADLVVVGSRGHGAHPGLLLGSTSLELAEHSTTPVLIVPSAR
ncbi:MAG: universal stress protein, partial [Acidimicrobiales bacterium]